MLQGQRNLLALLSRQPAGDPASTHELEVTRDIPRLFHCFAFFAFFGS